MKNRRLKNASDLAAAIRYNDKGYKILKEAYRKEEQADLIGMKNDLDRARVFFRMNSIALRRVENLRQALMDYEKMKGIPATILYDKVMNSVNLNEKTEKGIR